MAHEITFRNGKHEMAYVGAKPWHGLGQELQPGQPIEVWQKAAGMDWKAQRSVVRYATEREGNGLREWPDRHVIFRSDTREPLGMVSDHFKLVQPRECLEFFRDLVAVGGFHLETAGTLRGGSKFWALAGIATESERVVGRDLVKGKLLVATAVDGSMETIVKNVAERVVCANTMAVALGETGAQVVKVSHRSLFDEARVKAKMGLTVDAFHRFIGQMRDLSKLKVTHAAAQKFVADLLDLPIDPKLRKEAVEESKPLAKILRLFEGEGRGSREAGVAGTGWGLLNAVTEYVDHHAPARSASNRMESAWFGRGDDLKTEALVELVKQSA